MTTHTPTHEIRRGIHQRGQRGSAILAAFFVLSVVTLAGIALCFLSRTEVKMSQGAVRVKEVYFLAEAGVEDGRTHLFNVNGENPFDGPLADHAGDHTLDFRPEDLQIVWNEHDVPSLSGYGNDVPLRPLRRFAGGWYAAFLTNDPGETQSSTSDGNKRVMVTGVGVGPERSVEIAQAIVERYELLPSIPPATVTLLGDPSFEGGSSSAHDFSGDDCGGHGHGVPGLVVPTIGVVGAEAAAEADATIGRNGPDYEAGGFEGADTVADLTNAAGEPTLDQDISAAWLDCQNVHRMVEAMRGFADRLCTDGGSCTLPWPPQTSDLIVVDGDFALDPPGGAGTLVVTGELRYSGSADWNGLILVFGEGRMVQEGAGNGTISGAVMVADVAGPDGIYGNADDCSGGFGTSVFDLNGGGNADTRYCLADIVASKPRPPYRVVNFRQR